MAEPIIVDADPAAPAVKASEPVQLTADSTQLNGTHTNGTYGTSATDSGSATKSADTSSVQNAVDTSTPAVSSTTPTNAVTTAASASTSTPTVADTKPASTRTTTRRAASLSTPPPATALPAAPYVILSVEAPNNRSARVEAVPSDLIVEIRHFLLSCPETCEYTQYHLEWQQQPLNDYAELGMYDGLVKAAGGGGTGGEGRVEVLKMVNEWYDERGARLHVRRVREMLVSPPCHVQTSLVLTLDEQQERERKKKEKGEKRRGQGKDNSSGGMETEAADSAEKMDEAFSPIYSLPPTASSTSASASPSSLISLADYQSHCHATPPSPPVLSCLHSLTYSAYNPPPPSRKLRGDLLYLTVHTLENNHLHITAAIDGFYVNQSTDDEWSGEMSSSGYKSHSLVELLRKASPLFHTRFNQNLARRVLMHPFQQQDVIVAAHSWLSSRTEHTADEGRAEDALLQTYGMDVRGAMRDWNEEYQSCVEMEVVGEDERVRRDSHLQRVYSEYVLAAREAAAAILNGHIAPVNALDPPRQHVYIYNSIFFSHAVDGRSLYSPPLTPLQADTIFHKQANADLHGVNRYINLHMPHLHTLATVIVDCRGRRLIAQSIIPGIFHSDRASKHVYGSMDQGETVLKSKEGEVGEEVEAVLRAASVRVHVSAHRVLDARGDEVEVVAAVDTKGIVGSDHRFYALDLMRTTPRDAGRPEARDTWAVMRPELVERYVRRIAMDRMFSADTAAGEKEKEAAGGSETGDGGKEQRQLRQLLAEQMKGTRDIDAQYIDTINSITFNPDLLVHTKHTLIPPTSPSTATELADLTALSTFLLSSIIPQFVASAALLEQPAADGEELTRLLHEAGVSVRWLGAVCREAEKRSVRWLAWLCTVEMVVRAVKCIMREEMREVEAGHQLVGAGRVDGWYYGSVLVRGLNGVLGKRGLGVGVTEDELSTAIAVLKQHREERDKQQQAEMDGADRPKPRTGTGSHHTHGSNKKSKRPTHNSASAPSAASTVLRLPDGRKAPVDPLSAVNVWVAIRDAVKEKYGFELPSIVALSGCEKLSVLRAVCRRLGIVVVAKEYDLVGSNEPFTLDDVIDVLPVVKQLDIVNEDAEQLVQSAVASLQQGHLSYAYQYLSDAMQSHNVLYGPMHVRTAAVYQLLALTCYQAGDVAAAVDFAQRCVLIYERVCGMDDARTAHAHLALALYLQTSGHSDAAAVHCQHALWIYQLLAGENSVYAAAACANMGMINQSKGRLRDGLRWCEEALKRNVAALGDNHVQVGLRSATQPHTQRGRRAGGAWWV